MRLLLVPCFVLAACGSKASPRGDRPAPVTTERTIEIPAGRLVVGSMPNLAGRDGTLEADRIPVDLEEFEIDRTPRTRGDAVHVGVTRDQAARLCEADDMRLCGELEWERACAGENSHVYPTGGSLDLARCRTDACRSSFGVESLGTRVAEWTASTVAISGRTLAVVRGSVDESVASHRCAARRLVDPTDATSAIGFRCCAGNPSEVDYPAEEAHPVFEPVTASEEDLRTALASVPELAGVSGGFRLFTDAERAAVIARAAQRTPPFVVDTNRVVRGVLRWTPTAGESVWVVSGRAGNAAVIALLYPLGDGGFAHAASLTMPNEPSAAVLTTRDPATKTLGFSTCFGCGGEDGEIRFRDDGRFIVVTR